MCRNIKNLANFEPPATDAEIRASALQFIRKISGATKPSKANEVAFELAVDKIEAIAAELLSTLKTSAPARDRDSEMQKAKARSAKRFGSPLA